MRRGSFVDKGQIDKSGQGVSPDRSRRTRKDVSGLAENRRTLYAKKKAAKQDATDTYLKVARFLSRAGLLF